MNFVLFQFLSDIGIFGIILLILWNLKYKKINNKIILFILGILFLLKFTLYYNFANSTQRIKEELKNSNQIFESKLKEPVKKIQKFNYKKEFNNISNSINQEQNKIHNSIKGNNQ